MTWSKEEMLVVAGALIFFRTLPTSFIPAEDQGYYITGITMPDGTALDRTDVRILRALQADGRLTNAELAARVNVSPATCHRRTQRLFDDGLRRGFLPWRGDPRRWPARTRRLAGWFTATAVVGQVHTLAVTFLIGVGLSKSAIALFRFVQVVVLQPVQNFNQAVTSLLVPRFSKAAVMAKEQVNVQLRRVMTLLAGLAVTLVVLGGLLAQVIFPLVPRYADAAPLAWPVLLQSAIYMLQAPVLAALRGMHRGPLQFLQYVVFAVASVAGLVAGALTGELLLAAWGLAAGTGVGFVAALVLYRHALRREPAASPPIRRPKRRLARPPSRSPA